MRKDKLSSFQAKKQKLLKIKEILLEEMKDLENYEKYWKPTWQKDPVSTLIEFNQLKEAKIWEIVKDE